MERGDQRGPSGFLAAALTCSALAASFGLVPGPAAGPDTGVAREEVGPALPAGSPGAAAGAEPFEELGLLRWRVAVGGPVRGTPALADGVLFFGTAAGVVHAVDASTGEALWRHRLEAPVVSSPEAADGRLLVASRGSLVALDAADGSRLWRHEFGADLPLPWGHEGWDYGTSSPVSIDGMVYVGSGDGHVRALAVDDGEPVWSHDVGARVRPTPTIAGDVLYIGDSAGIFHALDRHTGSELWRFETAGHTLDAAEFGFDRRQIYSAATVADGVVYFGSRDAELYALDAATGDLRWSSNDGTSGWVIGTPTVHGDVVLETRSSSTRVRALAADDGAELWRVETGGAIFAAPLAGGDTALVVNGNGLLIALDVASGRERWRYGVGDSVWAPPLVAEGALYVGDDDGRVWAFDRRAAPTPRLAVYWDDEMADRSSLGSAPRHEVVASWFERRGYRRLDATGVEAFLEARTEDGLPSVVVFAMDGLPEPLRRGLGPDAGLRRYLESGGKAVWLGTPPALLERDDEGRPVALDRSRTSALLDVDLGAFDSDRHMVTPTEEGRAWGLRSWWTAGPQVYAGDRLVALGVDELGRISAWARDYGGPEGTGFVGLYATTDSGRLDEIRAVAEYGIFRSPATREIEAHGAHPRR